MTESTSGNTRYVLPAARSALDIGDERTAKSSRQRGQGQSRSHQEETLDALLAHERMLVRERDAQALSAGDVLFPLILALARMDAQATARAAGSQ